MQLPETSRPPRSLPSAKFFLDAGLEHQFTHPSPRLGSEGCTIPEQSPD